MTVSTRTSGGSTPSPEKHVNPCIFFKFVEGNLILWDYGKHKQFVIEPSYLERLVEWVHGTPRPDADPVVDQQLQENGILSDQPFPQDRWGWDVLSHIFHVGTRNVFHVLETPEQADKAYLEGCEEISPHAPELFTERPGPRTVLPAPEWEKLQQVSLAEALKQRMTSRTFDRTPVPLQTVSTLMGVTFGMVEPEGWSRMEALGIRHVGYRRTSSSGGALHPCDAYLVAFAVEGLEPGIYHYRSQDHQLTRIAEGDFAWQTGRMMAGQYFASDLSFGVFLAGCFERAWWKYPHSRCYRVVLLDAGHLSQTFQLVSTALGLQTWVSGAFHDDMVDEALGLLGDSTRSALFFMGAGRGENQPVSHTMLQELRTMGERKAREKAQAGDS